MKRIMKSFVASMAFAAMTPYALADILGDLPDATHAWAVHDPNRPRPPVVTVGAGGVPSDAVVLLDGTEATYRANWKSSRGGAAPWKLENGEIVSMAGNIACVNGRDARCPSRVDMNNRRGQIEAA